MADQGTIALDFSHRAAMQQTVQQQDDIGEGELERVDIAEVQDVSGCGSVKITPKAPKPCHTMEKATELPSIPESQNDRTEKEYQSK